jgi:hypothetical protein
MELVNQLLKQAKQFREEAEQHTSNVKRIISKTRQARAGKRLHYNWRQVKKIVKFIQAVPVFERNAQQFQFLVQYYDAREAEFQNTPEHCYFTVYLKEI